MDSISVKDLDRRLRDDPVPPFLLDVREPEELLDGKIAEAVNIPMDQVEDRFGELPSDRDIVVICHLGARSAFITKRLRARGFDRVMNLDGGMKAWLEHGASR